VNRKSAAEDFKANASRRRWKSFSYAKALFVLLIITLPIVNPWVHGDGVGYYAYVHSLLIDHDLQFENEWRAANSSFTIGRVGPDGEILASQFTATHHLDNHFTVGPAILWAPFLIVVHLTVISLNSFGAHINSDGFGRPYLWTMAFTTVGYGFCGLLLCFHLAREFVAERWAFLAILGYWFASSLPVYMYLNPSWSHAHTLFSVSLFLWYWNRTRARRSLLQWIVIGLIAALMVNVYYLNVVWLLLPAFEAIANYFQIVVPRSNPLGANTTRESFASLFGYHFTFVIAFVVGMLPTLITRKIIYGGYLQTGYPGAQEWFWTNPVPGSVWFSSDHGLFTWTPILILGLVGLVLFLRIDRALGFYLLAIFAVFSYILACYVNWDGISSFGNRFFISIGPAFIIGLAALFDRIFRGWAGGRKAFVSAASVVALFAAWNIGFIIQWGDHLIPVRGEISWRAMVHNQFCVVPVKLWDTADSFLFHRNRLLHQIEQKDNNELRNQNPDSGNHP
jgi:hypothetical protein